MKKYLLLSLLLIIAACSSNDDDSSSYNPNLPAAPINLIAEQSIAEENDLDILLTWGDNSFDEDGFIIERKTGSEAYSLVGTNSADDDDFLDSDVAIGITYTYRIYSYNSYGNSAEYSNEITITVTDPMEPVTIGSQMWMKRNLDVEYYRNGDLIPQVTDPTEWANLTTGAWCYYENTTANGKVYGKLYNCYAVKDPRGLAPTGWHIASDSEWTALATYLGGTSVAGGPLKASTVWNEPNTGATNTTGFSAFPGGYRKDDGTFMSMDYSGYWWSSTALDLEFVWSYSIYNSQTNLFRSYFYKQYGYSVRCVKD